MDLICWNDFAVVIVGYLSQNVLLLLELCDIKQTFQLNVNIRLKHRLEEYKIWLLVDGWRMKAELEVVYRVLLYSFFFAQKEEFQRIVSLYVQTLVYFKFVMCFSYKKRMWGKIVALAWINETLSLDFC